MAAIASQSKATVPLRDARPRMALGFFWLLGALFVLTVGVGRAWDAAWHASHVFETFWSPPHVFVYTMSTLNGLLAAAVILVPGLRRWFGPGFRVMPLPFDVPGALYLLGGGFVVLGFAGLALDNLWHSSFGLDETNWSAPHAMIGWALLTIVLGLAAARLALRSAYPLRWYTALLIGLLLLSSSAVMLGPLARNNTPDTLRAIAAIPALAAQPAAQHTYRIYLAWNLARTNPIVIPLGALWAGVALALLRRLDRRAGVLLLTVALWSLLAALGDRRTALRLEYVRQFDQTPAAWLPLPILPAAIAFVAACRVGWRERRAWLIAGLVFGAFACLIWANVFPGLLLIPLAAPALAIGAWLGERLFGVLECPTEVGAKALLLLAVVVPLLTGAVDLYLRTHTP